MADSYINIHLHLVFAVKNRSSLLCDQWRDELFRYIGGIAKNNGYMPIAVGGWRDHVHMLIGCDRVIDVPSLIKDIKLASNQWIQKKSGIKFEWQRGYGCFSISNTHVEAVSNYIKSQEEHHSKTSMLDEFRRLFNVNGIDYNEHYFFQDIE